MAERLFGIETEYAVTPLDGSGRPLARIDFLRSMMRVAQETMPHLPDSIARGLFLQNGCRLYVDFPDHPEASTPEVANPWDAIRYVQAGDRIVARLAEAARQLDHRIAEVVVLRCNVDYSGTDSSWGSHESYLHHSDPSLLPSQLVPHLVSRVVYTAAGGFNSLFANGLQFTLSPRVWHLTAEVSSQSTHSRGIFHTKNEPLASRGHHRLHILCGESVSSEIAGWLRVATTALVVALLDGGVRPGDALQLRAPLLAMRRFASNPLCRARAMTTTGSRLTAVEIQRHYLEQAEAHLGAPFMPAWSEEACRQWRAMLDRLDGAPDSVSASLDWAIKLALFREHARRRGFAWDSLPHWNHVANTLSVALREHGVADLRSFLPKLIAPRSPIAAELKRLTPYLEERGLKWDLLPAFVTLQQELFEIDARFGQVGDHGIFAALDRAGVLEHRVPGVDNIGHAVDHPPPVGRAKVRAGYVRDLCGESQRYICDWQRICDRVAKRFLDLGDPMATSADWQPWTPGPHDLLERMGRPLQGLDL